MISRWTLLLSQEPKRPPDALESTTPGIPAALQEQLGLKLKSKKTQVDMLIVDSADRIPTGN
jgi:uncharacterized protein (TIGR03435 family)